MVEEDLFKSFKLYPYYPSFWIWDLIIFTLWKGDHFVFACIIIPTPASLTKTSWKVWVRSLFWCTFWISRCCLREMRGIIAMWNHFLCILPNSHHYLKDSRRQDDGKYLLCFLSSAIFIIAALEFHWGIQGSSGTSIPCITFRVYFELFDLMHQHIFLCLCWSNTSMRLLDILDPLPWSHFFSHRIYCLLKTV